MKKFPFLIAALIVLLFSFTSCETVFVGSLAGRVVENSGSSENTDQYDGVPGAVVALYTDYSRYLADKTKFEKDENLSLSTFHPDSDTLTTTSGSSSSSLLSGGSYSFTNIPWGTQNPSFGGEGDTREVYLLCYAPGYELGCLEESVKLISDTINEAPPIVLKAAN